MLSRKKTSRKIYINDKPSESYRHYNYTLIHFNCKVEIENFVIFFKDSSNTI